jgi:hypothetical protein
VEIGIGTDEGNKKGKGIRLATQLSFVHTIFSGTTLLTPSE